MEERKSENERDSATPQNEVPADIGRTNQKKPTPQTGAAIDSGREGMQITGAVIFFKISGSFQSFHNSIERATMLY